MANELLFGIIYIISFYEYIIIHIRTYIFGIVHRLHDNLFLSPFPPLEKVDPNPLLGKVEQKSKPFRKSTQPLGYWLDHGCNPLTTDLDQPFPKVE